jgi:hypothetical protein
VFVYVCMCASVSDKYGVMQVSMKGNVVVGGVRWCRTTLSADNIIIYYIILLKYTNKRFK